LPSALGACACRKARRDDFENGAYYPARRSGRAVAGAPPIQPASWEGTTATIRGPMLDSRSSDLLTLARYALEGAVRTRGDLIELLGDEPVTRPPRKAKALPPGEICATA
jgi:hypothetical protein